MKIYVKAAFLFLFFFAAVNASFAQTKKPTTPPKQPNTSTETIATEDSTNFVADTTQNNATNNVAKSEYMNNMTNQRNTDELTETVKGKRKKNEFSSGGGGGQYNNPHPEEVKPKSKAAIEPAPGTTSTGDRL